MEQVSEIFKSNIVALECEMSDFVRREILNSRLFNVKCGLQATCYILCLAQEKYRIVFFGLNHVLWIPDNV